jgi:hypothetical protein
MYEPRRHYVTASELACLQAEAAREGNETLSRLLLEALADVDDGPKRAEAEEWVGGLDL